MNLSKVKEINFRNVIPWLKFRIAENSVELAVFFAVLFSILWIFYPKNDLLTGFALSAYASIFVALKYNLDKLNYQRELFEDRFKIFNEICALQEKIDRLLTSVKAEKEIEKQNKIKSEIHDFLYESHFKLTEIYRRSFFIFNEETRDFIKKFRYAFIVLNSHIFRYSLSDGEKKQLEDVENFLIVNLAGIEDLPNKFAELKLSDSEILLFRDDIKNNRSGVSF